MKKKILFALSMVFCGSGFAQASSPEMALFQNYDACFILFDVKQNKITREYNPHHRCAERLAADSTFKIPLSLMAFDQAIISQNTIFQWDGQQRTLPQWNQNQTPRSWLENSVLWVSQELTPKIGLAQIKHYLAWFKYGNQDFSGDLGENNGLTHAWLSSSLKISAFEQLEFLKALVGNKLPLSAQAIKNTKENLYLGKLPNGAAYYGKTGSGLHYGRQETLTHIKAIRDGWFIGFIEHGSEQYIFVSNLTDKKAPEMTDNAYGSQVLKPMTMALLNELFAGCSQ